MKSPREIELEERISKLEIQLKLKDGLLDAIRKDKESITSLNRELTEKLYRIESDGFR